MNEDELREALKKIRVEDVLLQTVATLIDVAARRMGLAEEDGPKQLDQAKLAIDAIRALQPRYRIRILTGSECDIHVSHRAQLRDSMPGDFVTHRLDHHFMVGHDFLA